MVYACLTSLMGSNILVTLYLNKKLLSHLRIYIHLVMGVLALTSAVSCQRGDKDDLSQILILDG